MKGKIKKKISHGEVRGAHGSDEQQEVCMSASGQLFVSLVPALA